MKQLKIRIPSGYLMILRNYCYLLSRKWHNGYLSFYLHTHTQFFNSGKIHILFQLRGEGGFLWQTENKVEDGRKD